MKTIRITHCDTKEYIYPLNRKTLHVKLECEGDPEYSIYIVYWNRHFEDVKESKLESLCENGLSNFYSVKLSFTKTAKYIRYYFVLRNANESLYYSPYGLTSHVPKKYFEYTDTNVNDIFSVPQWAKGAIGYQIFPERFFNGDFENDPPSVEKWADLPNRENFFGGDLRGIINKFDHIIDLGIDVIYLTPIFYSPSNHKYDTIDYFKIDPSFGNTKDLKELVSLCHTNNMKVILDGVFNHIGYYSHQFQDVIKKGKQSSYWDWFYITGDEVDTENINYECVGYFKWMPKINFSIKEVRKYFLKVGEYWIEEAKIDGWRLDVSDEVDFTFWQDFRKKIKSIDQDILLIGETWKSGIDLLRGDQMDTIMNYRFRDAIIDYFAEGTIEKESFMYRVESFLFDYPLAVHNILYNLLDSHDTARFLTTCNDDLNKFKLSVAFQMTFPGLPFVYYGDEIGMTGETDPDCRRTMAWESINNEILLFYKNMIDIRRRSKALKFGTFKNINTKNDVYGFVRDYDEESIIVLFNNTEEKFKLSCRFGTQNESKVFEILNEGFNLDNSRNFILQLPAYSFEILSLEREGDDFKIKSLVRNS